MVSVRWCGDGQRDARVAIALLAIITLSSFASASSQDDPPPSAPPSSPFPGIPSIPDDPEQADRNCRLLGPFALFVQAVMGVVVVGSLVLKRQREKPKRPWKIWLLDISKQMLGQLFVHTLNVALSYIGSRASAGEDNPCGLYFLNILVDTTIGVGFIYYSIRFLTHYFTDVLGWPGFVSGQYFTTPAIIGRRRKAGPRRMGSSMSSASAPAALSLDSPTATEDVHRVQREASRASIDSVLSTASHPDTRPAKPTKPRLTFFFRQLALYLLSLLLMKVMVVLLFALFPFLYAFGRWVLDLFGEHKTGQIFFVMALFPLAMNTLQFWLIDSVLRHNPNTSKYPSEDEAQLDGGAGQQSMSEGDLERGARDGMDDGGDMDVQRQQQSTTGHSDGPWTVSWWTDLLSGGATSKGKDRRGRGRYQEIDGRHSIGEASTDNEEDEEDSAHTYPPNSQSSSVAQLESGGGGGGGGAGATEEIPGPVPSSPALMSKRKMGDKAYGATLGSPPLRPQRGIGSVGQHASTLLEASDAAAKYGIAATEEEAEAWDAWSEDEAEAGEQDGSQSATTIAAFDARSHATKQRKDS